MTELSVKYLSADAPELLKARQIVDVMHRVLGLSGCNINDAICAVNIMQASIVADCAAVNVEAANQLVSIVQQNLQNALKDGISKGEQKNGNEPEKPA